MRGARSNKRINVDLTTLDPVLGSEFDIGYAIIQVLDFPVGMRDVELSVDDGSFFYPITGSLKLQAPDGGDKFSRIQVRGQAQAGVLVLMCTDDPVPLLVAGLAGDPASLRWLDLYYGPHVPEPIGTVPASMTGLLRPGIPVNNMLGFRNIGTGTGPYKQVSHGRPIIICAPGAAGSAGVALDYCFGWLRSAAGGPSGHPSAKHQSWHLEVELNASALGGTDGIGAGVYFTPTDGVIVNEGVPDNPVSPNAFFGVVRNGAGGWQVAARAVSGGPLTLLDNISGAWPAAMTTPVRLHIALTDADYARGVDGTVAVLLNEKLVRLYTNMLLFPLAANNGLVGFSTYRAVLMAKGAPGVNMEWANIEQWTSKGAGVAQ